MNTEELTQVVTAHQSAISRHDSEMAAIRATLQQSTDQHTAHERQHAAHVAKMEALQAFNQEQLNQLTAGLLDLRVIVADSIQRREAN